MKQLGMACLLLIAGWHLQAACADVPDQKQLAALVARLGSDSFTEREQAARELEAAGPAALEALRAALKHRDSEVSGRAARLLFSIEEQALTSKMLAGKKLRLVLNNVPVLDAVKEMSTLSGYPCDFVGNINALGERRITLDTGEVTYWEALQQLCEKGRLTESVTTSNLDVGRTGKTYYPTLQRSTVLLTDGARQLPVCNHGSVRIVAQTLGTAAAGEMQILLDVAAEARLQNFGVVGLPTFSKIVDDQAQTLAMIRPEPDLTVDDLPRRKGKFVKGNVVSSSPVVPQRLVTVRIKLGEKPARTLSELSGKLTVQALNAPELLVKVEDVLHAGGRTFMGKEGNGIHVRTVEKHDDGSYRIRLAIESPELQDPYAGRNIKFRVNGNFNSVPYPINTNFPKMIDADGKVHAAEALEQGTEYNDNGQFMLNALLVYRPSAAPAQLLLHGQRTILFLVPFTLKNVPIS